jgi:mitochondrial fission protein ELM1
MTQKTCWVASDGKIGIDNQCIGLAEALGLAPIVKHVELRSPWKQLFPFVPLPLEKAFTPGDVLVAPWPDLLITGGRTGAAISLFVKQASGGKTVTVQVQNPHIKPGRFDVLIVGEHDGITEAGNVVAIKGALNRVTPQKIADGMAKFPQLASLPGPRVAVLLGGTNRCYTFEKADAEKLAAQLAALAASGHSVMVTASRRTGAENEAILRAALTGPNTYFWDNAGENPYFAMLGYADAILPTVDSISMVSEAATTGKPVLVVPLTGGDAKFRAFHQLIERAGITRPFTGKIERWDYIPLNDTAKAAAVVKPLLDAA